MVATVATASDARTPRAAPSLRNHTDLVLNSYSVQDWRALAIGSLGIDVLRRIAARRCLRVPDRRKRAAFVSTIARLPPLTVLQELDLLTLSDQRRVAKALELSVRSGRKADHQHAIRAYAAPRLRFNQTNVLGYVIACYLQSTGFNGCRVTSLAHHFGASEAATRRLLRKMILSERLSINFGDRHPNPHILAFSPEPMMEQASKVNERPLDHACLYPTGKVMARCATVDDFNDRPFSRRLALAEAQLSFEAFRLEVLDIYRRDPRYHFVTSDVAGQICTTAEGTKSLPDGSHVFLRSYGFAYNDQWDRAVAVFLWDLHRLTPEHQQIWKAHRVEGFRRIHPGFYDTQVGGERNTHGSVFDAFLAEKKHINEMCALMGRPPIFRNPGPESEKPRRFSFLVRPTLSEYHEFVLLLDKLMSDDIDPAFFQGDVLLIKDEPRKGTIVLLDEWLKKCWEADDPGPLDEMIATFKRIRKLRQRPAHAIESDIFDQKYVHEQRSIMREAYAAVRLLRLVLANHPRAKDYKVPEWLAKGRVWFI
jgi:hypothetical protein